MLTICCSQEQLDLELNSHHHDFGLARLVGNAYQVETWECASGINLRFNLIKVISLIAYLNNLNTVNLLLDPVLTSIDELLTNLC